MFLIKKRNPPAKMQEKSSLGELALAIMNCFVITTVSHLFTQKIGPGSNITKERLAWQPTESLQSKSVQIL
jgi:hypothetical protein